MALGILKIVFIALIILVAMGQFALYKNRWRQGATIGNTILGVIISYMALPHFLVTTQDKEGWHSYGVWLH